jgi:ribonucleoside-diphosphate reductase alpha chain
MTAGSYPDDGLGEVFLKLGKQGSTLAGVMDAFSMAISISLQYGVPLETYVAKFTNMKFEPAGLTDDPDIRMAQSIVDYIFRRLALDYLPLEKRAALGIYSAEERKAAAGDHKRGAFRSTIRRWQALEEEGFRTTTGRSPGPWTRWARKADFEPTSRTQLVTTAAGQITTE